MDSTQRLELIAIQARRERLEQLLHGFIETLTEDGREFYSRELVDAWKASGDESWNDRRYAFSVVQPFLGRLVEEGCIEKTRFEPHQGPKSGIGRTYYARSSSWRPSVPPES